jgi:iron complex outermembrane receptor protein
MTIERSRFFRVLSSLAAALSLAALPALAQEAPPEATQAAAAGDTVEEILITTQKRSQNLQDVPISVTAITGDDLAEMGITESVDIAAQTPGLKIGFPSGETNTPAIFLRGVGLNDYNANSNGSVGWYMDEVYISQVTAQNFQLFDLERVEVARGPQGTLYGRNTTGGLVNFISVKPSHDEAEGYATLSYGKWDAVKVEGAYGGPITDTVAGRIALAYNRADGYIDNEAPGGGPNNDVNNWAARAALDWRVSDSLNVLLNLHGAQNRSLSAQYEHQGTMDAFGNQCSRDAIESDDCVDAFGYRDSKNNERGEYNLEGDLDIDTFGSFLRIEYEIGEMTLTSLTAYEEVDKVFEEDTDASPNQLIEIAYLNNGWEFTQELRLAGESERAHWQVGAYYLKESMSVDNYLDLFRGLRPLAISVDPVAYPDGFAPGGCPTTSGPPADPCGGAPIFLSRTHYEQEVESAAAFGQLEWEFTERLRGTIGARFTWEARDFEEDVEFQEPTFTAPLFSIEDDVDFQEWSGKVGLDYRPIDDLLLYLSVSRGFKSGGFSGAFAFDPAELPPFDPETILAYEIGSKWDLFDQRLRLNVGAFYYDYDDLQIFTTVNISPNVTITILDNAGKAKIYGGEVEIEATPFAGLTIGFGGEFLHTELTEYENTAGLDYEGNELVFAPGVSLNGRVRYEIGIGPGQLALQTDFNYQDRVYFETGNDPVLSQDAYGVWNARVAYAFQEGRYEAAVFGRNLLDKNYLTSAFPLAGFGLNEQMWGHPRTYGVELTARF